MICYKKKKPFTVGWMSAPNPFQMNSTECTFEFDARSYTQSTMSYISIVGLQTSLREILRLGPDRIEKHSNSLANLLLDEISKTKWNPILNQIEACNSNHIVSIESATEPVEATLEKLKENGLICSSRGGKIRVSLAHYNDESDIANLIEHLT